MEIIRETIEEKPYGTRIFESNFGQDWAVLDIETTGLSPKVSKVILVGIAFPKENRIEAVQLFARSRAEEEELLLALDKVMTEARIRNVVTYNGASFDLPYLEYRYHANRIQPCWLPVGNLDIYRAVRYHSPLKDILPNLKQKSVEIYMGLSDDRTDEIGGEESVKLYEEYEAFSNPEDRERILLHNRDDIVQLSRLMQILKKLDLERILYFEGIGLEGEKRLESGDESSPGNGSITKKEGRLLVLKKSRPALRELTCEGICRPGRDYYGFEPGYTISVHGGKFKLSIPGETLEGCFVVKLTELFPDNEPERSDSPSFDAMSVLRNSPHREGDYLILTTPGEVHYREVNALVHTLIKRIP